MRLDWTGLDWTGLDWTGLNRGVRCTRALAACFLLLPFAGRAQDVSRPGGWFYHDLGPTTRCLSSLNDTATSHTQAAVLYRNAPTTSTNLYIYMEGGGSCYSPESCAAEPPANSDPDGYSVDDFLSTSDNKLDRYLYLRTSPYGASTRVSPFASMNMAMIPYCTGDVHAGNKTRVWDRKYYFWGNSNFQIAIKYLLQKYPATTTIWLMGTSAGGVGATVQYSFVKRAVKQLNQPVQIHLIEDSSSGLYDPDSPVAANSLDTWKAFLPGCEGASAPEPDDVSPPDSMAPFPTDSEVSALAVQINDQLPGNPVTQSTTGRLSCGRVQDTRKYNRAQYDSFRYAFMTFAWDRAQNPYEPRDRASYDLMYSQISGYVAEVEAINAAKSHHLYIDNTTFFDLFLKPTCPRHVVTNFRPEGTSGAGAVIEEAHYEFISKMINTPSSWANIFRSILQCPSEVLE